MFLPLIQLILITATVKPEALIINVHTSSDVAGRCFTLAEISELSGDPTLVTQAGAIEVGTSPLPGLSRSIYPGDIIARLRFNHIDTKNVSLNFPPSVRILRGGSEVAVQEIVQAAELAVRTARKDLVDENTTFEPSQLPARIFVANGKRELQAGSVHSVGSFVNVPVTISVDGRPIKTVDVSFKLKRTSAVLVAKRTLEPHTALTEEDITLASMEAAPGAGAPLTDVAALIGKRTTRRIIQGAALTIACVECSPIIMPGAKVNLQVAVGGVVISSPGIARTQAAQGETVRVYATETKKELTGIALDAGTVRVEDKK